MSTGEPTAEELVEGAAMLRELAHRANLSPSHPLHRCASWLDRLSRETLWMKLDTAGQHDAAMFQIVLEAVAIPWLRERDRRVEDEPLRAVLTRWLEKRGQRPPYGGDLR